MKYLCISDPDDYIAYVREKLEEEKERNTQQQPEPKEEDQNNEHN